MLRLILLIVILVLIISFFGISLQSLFHSPVTQANFAYLGHLISTGWHLIVQFFDTLLHTKVG